MACVIWFEVTGVDDCCLGEKEASSRPLGDELHVPAVRLHLSV